MFSTAFFHWEVSVTRLDFFVPLMTFLAFPSNNWPFSSLIIWKHWRINKKDEGYRKQYLETIQYLLFRLSMKKTFNRTFLSDIHLLSLVLAPTNMLIIPTIRTTGCLWPIQVVNLTCMELLGMYFMFFSARWRHMVISAPALP